MAPSQRTAWNSTLLPSDDKLFQRIVESIGEGVWIIDAAGHTSYANPELLRMLAASPEDLTARHSFDFVPPEDLPLAQQQFDAHMRGRATPFECRLIRMDGRIIWARITSRPLLDAKGNPIGLLGIFSDITEQRRTAAALSFAEDQLRLAVDASGLGTFNCDYPLDQFHWNDTCKSHFFLPADAQPTLQLFFDRMHPDDREPTARALENSARQHAVYDVEYRTVSPVDAGHIKWIRAIGRYAYKPDGSPARIDGVTMNVTDRKLLEQALRDESLTTQTLYALSKTLVTEFDNEVLVQNVTDAGRVLTNAAFGAFFYNVTNLEGNSYMLYTLSGVDRASFEKFPMPRATAIFAPTFNGSGPLRSDDITKDPRYGHNAPHHGMPKGHLPVRSYLAVPVVSRFGHVIGGLFYGHPDPARFTERDERTLVGIASHAAIALDNARLLNEARQASAAKDQFLAVLSHELRTPLNPVLLTASMMASDTTLPPDVRKNAEVIRRNVELEARLIDDMLDLTRIAKGKLELQSAINDVHADLRHVVEMFEHDLRGKHLALTLDLAATQHHVQGDPTRLKQVWWNLLRNAIKFTDNHGKITIRTRNVQAPPPPPASSASATRNDSPSAPFADPANAPHLVVDIIDNGIGIDPDQLGRLFNAFQQGDSDISRRFGGLGLGLSISRSLVQIHDGTLTASSGGPGKGATFTTQLPTTPAPTRVVDICQLPRPRTDRILHILLVEDHIDTATTMARLLTTLGHNVTVAHTVASAVELATSQHFDAFLCDIGLPDGTGIDVLRQIPIDRRPCAIALTGYGMEDDIQRSLQAGFADHLTKPLNLERLLNVLDQLHPCGQA